MSSLEASLSAYGLQRVQHYYIGTVLIPIPSLQIVPALQRPFDPDHADSIKHMYAAVDNRGVDPLECIVPLDKREQVESWVKEQEAHKLTLSTPADLLRIGISDCSFPIIKGLHRYKAYCMAKELGKLPKDAPHLDCLAVKLFYSGVFSDHAPFPGAHTCG